MSAAASAPAPAPARDRRSLAPFLGHAAVALGIVGVLAYALRLDVGAGLPDVVRYAAAATAVLEIGLGFGVAARRRAPWAFAVSLEGTITVFFLIVVPRLAHAGALGVAALALAAARLALLVLLVEDAEEF